MAKRDCAEFFAGGVCAAAGKIAGYAEIASRQPRMYRTNLLAVLCKRRQMICETRGIGLSLAKCGSRFGATALYRSVGRMSARRWLVGEERPKELRARRNREDLLGPREARRVKNGSGKGKPRSCRSALHSKRPKKSSSGRFRRAGITLRRWPSSWWLCGTSLEARARRVPSLQAGSRERRCARDKFRRPAARFFARGKVFWRRGICSLLTNHCRLFLP